ncbi:MAG: hypothetical protein OEZ01_08620 [Candidatus Heimdallarchaeota archaeon]|nr:hypothetical protein [Candidatus Heimdallarchaeota archaeon]MDH5646057.1 hypothetical protein [Candidatus Heimdallarchaeota archaeon]
MNINVVEGSNGSIIYLKKGLSDYREDLIVMLFINIIWVFLIILYPNLLLLWLLFIVINSARFYFLQFNNLNQIPLNNQAIENSYNSVWVNIIPSTSLIVRNYGEFKWKNKSDNNSSSTYFYDDIIAIFMILYYLFQYFFLLIKPNTEYYLFVLSHPTEGNLNIFHLRTNDHEKIKELSNIISEILGVHVIEDVIK